MNKSNYKQVLAFWFSPENQPKWFIKNKEFDQEITSKFYELYQEAVLDRLEDWLRSP